MWKFFARLFSGRYENGSNQTYPSPRSGTFLFKNRRYDAAKYELFHDLGDSLPMHDMGPNYVWIPDGLKVRRRKS